MTAPFVVKTYSPVALRQAISSSSLISKDALEKKAHRLYLEEYLQTMACATLVVEREYVDRDYLEDHASYYVRCFRDYKRRCTRLHFFTSKFDEEAFEALLRGEQSPISESQLDEDYLGFVVVKPLPSTIIGRTCLKTYPTDGGRRNYPATRDYPVTLFGIRMSVRSLAFQEQDQVVAACATSALWSAFQATALLYQHLIPSPIEITKAAGRQIARPRRLLPNDGLAAVQLAGAIQEIGLEPVAVGVGSEAQLRDAAYAYLRLGNPALLLIELVELSATRQQALGLHAIALTGFSLGKPAPVPRSPTGLLLGSSRIDKLYAHDDQVGPFARLGFASPSDAQSARNVALNYKTGPVLTTSWRLSAQAALGEVFAIASVLLVPIYHKVRIEHQQALAYVAALDAVLDFFQSAGVVSFTGRMTWNLHLDLQTVVKHDILSNTSLPSIWRRETLTRPMPRFLWRATAHLNGQKQIDLLLDATGIRQGQLLTHLLCYSTAAYQLLRTLASHVASLPPDLQQPIHEIAAWLPAPVP